MKKRKFGQTALEVSEIGFGAWAIGGSAMAGKIPIGWGTADDTVSRKALLKAAKLGINFIDTADFYGLGHSEELIGKVIGKDPEIIIATKVGHRLNYQRNIIFDYSKEYILQACGESLRRLKRDHIDYYQLHSARLIHLQTGECLEAMDILQKQGKIRFWGVSLSTYNPFPEAEFLLQRNLGNGLQLVFNIINQRAWEIISDAGNKGMAVIARMPLQFGLLSRKFTAQSTFHEDDHRRLRLKPEVLKSALENLDPVWQMAKKYRVTPAQLSLSFILNFSQVSTVIPGIRTPQQAKENSNGSVQLEAVDIKMILDLYQSHYQPLVDFMEKQERI
jgi:aryl-alcohol dehydrogenase-like predicted oxidoreductase